MVRPQTAQVGKSPSRVFKPDFGTTSAAEEIADPIYENKDPICISMKVRKDNGGVLAVVKEKKQQFFFSMKL